MERQYKLLIVDDENDILTTYRKTFTNQGFIVETAQDGEEGLKKLRTDEFDIAIVDIKIPKIGGIEVARHADEEGINTDLIMVSDVGEGTRSDVIAAIKAHVCDWFDKSGTEISDLLKRVKELAMGVSPEDIKRIVSLIPENN
jgi:DNA-binding response OmpR family regulator